MSKKSKLVMHKLVGNHVYTDRFNPDAYEAEKVCIVCGHVENSRPATIADIKGQNVENIEKVMIAFRHGMISANEALKALGLSDEETNEQMNEVLKDLK